jgi:hypothetical protein
MLPQNLVAPTREQLAKAHRLLLADQARANARVEVRCATRLRRTCCKPGTICTAQDLLAMRMWLQTMIYAHVLKVGGGGVRSPIDSMSLPRRRSIECALSSSGGGAQPGSRSWPKWFPRPHRFGTVASPRHRGRVVW